MAECREHHFIMEALAPVRPINHLMADFPGRWGFCGGWAIDLFLARPTRAHKDIDLAILRRDQRTLYRYLRARLEPRNSPRRHAHPLGRSAPRLADPYPVVQQPPA